MNRKKELEIYIHIPFCIRKCLYCDFLSFPANRKMQAEYMDQLRCEITSQGPWYADYLVTTVFIGGGTPSALDGEQITLLMQAVKKSFVLAEEAEITIEANPGTQLSQKLPLYRQAGINRLSLGLQSAVNAELRLLGRVHSFEDFLMGFQKARMAGFSNINVDLMSGIPGQTAESFKNTLRRVIMLKPEHISAYSLIVEEGTPYGDYYGSSSLTGEAGTGGAAAQNANALAMAGWPALMDEEEDRKIYHQTKAFLEESGYQRYEISNYARPGFACAHNLGYWTGKDYLGFGLGASSYVDGCRFANETDINRYLLLDFSAGDLESLHGRLHRLSRREQMEEFMFLGLRMTCGVSNVRFVQEFGVHIESIYGEIIRKLSEEGLLLQDGAAIRLSDWGMDVSNYVMSKFLLDVPDA